MAVSAPIIAQHSLAAGEVPSGIHELLSRVEPGMLRSLRQEIPAPAVQAHPTVHFGAPGASIYTVEFCTYLPEVWGDIIFWHMELGPGFFSFSGRTLYLASRGQD